MNTPQAQQAEKQKAWHLISTGRQEAAISLLQGIVSQTPQDAEAHYLLGCGHANLAQWDQAIEAFQTCTRLQPRVPQGHFALAGVWIALGQQEATLEALRITLELAENMPQAHLTMANVMIAQGNYIEARTHLDRALALDPGMSDAHVSLAAIDQAHGDFDQALWRLDQAVKSNPNNPHALCAKATTLMNLGRKTEARSFFRKALRAAPENPEAVGNLAILHNFSGEYAKAQDLIEPLLQKQILHPSIGVAFAQSCKHGKRCQEAVDYINLILQQPGLSQLWIKSLHFAAGKVLNDLKNYEAAFRHYKSGNETMKPLYDSVAHARYTNALLDTFTSTFFMGAPHAANDDCRPVFIVGMPRSGTSLTEQILAAHPQVHAAGELDDLPKLMKQMELDLQQGFPGCMQLLNQEQLNGYANRYLNRLTGLSKQALRITDKMPHNFFLIGLMQLLFPGARIIHCQRDPMDTGLSIYFQDFNEKHEYARDLFSIGTHYHQHLRLMEHWKQVVELPILDVHYEDMVGDQETATRRILDFCGLEWHEQCLEFYKVQRTVHTASFDQVRQPLYRKSVERWRHYEPFLDDLRAGLKREF